jgi:predicted ester cyclase
MEPQLAAKSSPEAPLPAIKEVARAFREDLWNSGDLSVADRIIAPDCLLHSVVPFPIDFARGPDAMRHLVFFYQMAFSEIRVTAEQIVAEGDTVAVRWTARGRHTGHLLGLPPTGCETITTGIDMLRIVDGKVVEGWVDWDVLSLLEQIMDLGAKPEEGFVTLFERLRPR